VASGYRGLVEHWERVVQRILSGEDENLEDYLNDMDSRQLLENARELVPPEIGEAFAARVHDADSRLRVNLVSAGGCLWGAIVAADRGWREDRHWWYFERPRNAGPILQRDLDRL
jgi:hypothetical protein